MGFWVEPKDNIAIVEFTAFFICFGAVESLLSAVSDLLRYDWLPVEDRDFTVPATVGHR
jgi:hypothetical protein